jgi:hypothetical protein
MGGGCDAWRSHHNFLHRVRIILLWTVRDELRLSAQADFDLCENSRPAQSQNRLMKFSISICPISDLRIRLPSRLCNKMHQIICEALLVHDGLDVREELEKRGRSKSFNCVHVHARFIQCTSFALLRNVSRYLPEKSMN